MKTPIDKISRSAKPFTRLTRGLLSLLYAFLLCTTSYANADSKSGAAAEYAVKAAYIYNILRFVSWDKNSPLAQSE